MTGKKKNTKVEEPRLSGLFKKSAVMAMARTALEMQPTMTKTGLRRLFSYGYRKLWTNGEDLYKNAKPRPSGPLGPHVEVKKGKDNGPKRKK